MGLIRCPNGHMFSSRKYGTICPYCNMETAKKEKVEEPPKDFDPEMELLEEDIEPVCGWLVCVDGARVGKDYKIRTGKNFIGRADEMDIQILGDNKISRRNHAIVVYDPKKRQTVLLPGDAAGIAYLNDEAVYVPTPLSPYDVVELGRSKFLFVPFCGEHFEWDDTGK
nr:FHA domain-containing protein [uncultured Cellulosilyticum sp.]